MREKVGPTNFLLARNLIKHNWSLITKIYVHKQLKMNTFDIKRIEIVLSLPPLHICYENHYFSPYLDLNMHWDVSIVIFTFILFIYCLQMHWMKLGYDIVLNMLENYITYDSYICTYLFSNDIAMMVLQEASHFCGHLVPKLSAYYLLYTIKLFSVFFFYFYIQCNFIWGLKISWIFWVYSTWYQYQYPEVE